MDEIVEVGDISRLELAGGEHRQSDVEPFVRRARVVDEDRRLVVNVLRRGQAGSKDMDVHRRLIFPSPEHVNRDITRTQARALSTPSSASTKICGKWLIIVVDIEG